MAELDYLTSANFMDQLDTGILICHLARIIQTKAREIVASLAPLTPPESPPGSPLRETAAEPAEFRDLHALLRSANTNAALLAAAKVETREAKKYQ